MRGRREGRNPRRTNRRRRDLSPRPRVVEQLFLAEHDVDRNLGIVLVQCLVSGKNARSLHCCFDLSTETRLHHSTVRCTFSTSHPAMTKEQVIPMNGSSLKIWIFTDTRHHIIPVRILKGDLKTLHIGLDLTG